MSLIREESRITWDAHEAASSAAEMNLGLEDPMYDAELAKVLACQPVDEAVTEYIDNFGKVPFGEQLKADFKRLVAFVFPVTPIERCAIAYRAYKREYLALDARLKELNIAQDHGD